MGGHGGLNILPQKKWNVYNYDNRDIVDKDKQLHADKLRKQYEDDREKNLDNKIEVLKKENHSDGPLAEYEQVQKPVHSLINLEMKKLANEHKHVNLFQEEERILINKEVADAKRLKEEEFLKDKNMDYSSRFLGTYNEERNMPWYSKRKGTVVKKKNKYYKNLDEVIEGVKSDSRVTKEFIEVQKRQEKRAMEEEKRDRTRQKFYQKYEDYEDRYVKMQKSESKAKKEIMRHEEEELLRQFNLDKKNQMDRLREKRLKRQQRERQRIEQLKKKMGPLPTLT